MKLKEIFREATKDRPFLIVWVLFLVLTLIFIILIALRISPSDLQIPVQYTSFGVTNFYRDRWYYLLAFLVMGGVMFVAHSMLALKLYARKGRELALPFMWLGVGVCVVMYFIVFALFGVVADIT